MTITIITRVTKTLQTGLNVFKEPQTGVTCESSSKLGAVDSRVNVLFDGPCIWSYSEPCVLVRKIRRTAAGMVGDSPSPSESLTHA
eukprot:CAMPEP_0204073436 /NCGR_PEP_ID=MMETSP0360-20130528/163290_1 /ASSEMBLY_ACC=CAM_ASM_000342 /TAXON_ID=268821 /ORGANISM="Scrippsiella Hangoei, Strain SHTV-5" /LENGTH=85 /DNA_ID=CAMNT_0051021837 /DNA_START=30 /DNA_END=284 /DNA_ORIENTATION=-